VFNKFAWKFLALFADERRTENVSLKKISAWLEWGGQCSIGGHVGSGLARQSKGTYVNNRIEGLQEKKPFRAEMRV